MQIAKRYLIQQNEDILLKGSTGVADDACVNCATLERVSESGPWKGVGMQASTKMGRKMRFDYLMNGCQSARGGAHRLTILSPQLQT